MKINRRQFVALTSGLISSPLFAVALDSAEGQPLFLSAASDGDDKHWVIGFRQSGNTATVAFRHQLSSRAHHISVHEGLGIYIVIARRPGSYLWVGDLSSGNKLAEITVPADRHLYGHGVFTAGGGLFYTTENAYQLINGDSGRIAVWSVSREGEQFSMARQMEFPSYGTGPHELLLSPDQHTLIVANGGIRTHPDRGREKLNINSMEPSLAYIETGSGQLMEQRFLDGQYHKASIRHLDQNTSGQIVLGMQYEGELFDSVPLLALHEQGKELKTLWAPESVQSQMSQYIGSVRYDSSGDFIAASCPRGNMITFWDAATGEMLNSVRSRDGCGVTAIDQGFLFTAGTGRITRYDLANDAMHSLDSNVTKVFWDNHLSIFSG